MALNREVSFDCIFQGFKRRDLSTDSPAGSLVRPYSNNYAPRLRVRTNPALAAKSPGLSEQLALLKDTASPLGASSKLPDMISVASLYF